MFGTGLVVSIRNINYASVFVVRRRRVVKLLAGPHVCITFILVVTSEAAELILEMALSLDIIRLGM